MEQIRLEICCGSAEDVLTAADAGADRVELNSALVLGGLTPSLAAMDRARRAKVEIMAMVRPREGGFSYTAEEFATMLDDAKLLLQAGADGIVFACLTPQGQVDEARCRDMLDVIGEKQSVFSRAIDTVPDWKAALDVLAALGVSRVLTSGQQATAPEGAQTIRKMVEYSAGRIEILPGSGVKPENAAALLRQTGCRQIHASMKGARLDDSAAGNSNVRFSGGIYPREGMYWSVERSGVEALRAALQSL